MKNCIIFLKHILWYVFTEKEVLSDQYASTLSQSNLRSIKGKALFVAGRGVIEIYFEVFSRQAEC